MDFDSYNKYRRDLASYNSPSGGLPSSELSHPNMQMYQRKSWRPRKKQKAGAPKHLWTQQEDLILELAVKSLGEKSWSDIAARLPGRVGKQCRDRWRNHLCPEVKKGSWTKEEDMLLFNHQRILGNQWAEIAKRVPGRTDLSVKNRYYSYLRKVVRQKARKEKEKENVGNKGIKAINKNKEKSASRKHNLRVDTSRKDPITVNESCRKRQKQVSEETVEATNQLSPLLSLTETPLNRFKGSTYIEEFPSFSPDQLALNKRNGKLKEMSRLLNVDGIHSEKEQKNGMVGTQKTKILNAQSLLNTGSCSPMSNTSMHAKLKTNSMLSSNKSTINTNLPSPGEINPVKTSMNDGIYPTSNLINALTSTNIQILSYLLGVKPAPNDLSTPLTSTPTATPSNSVSTLPLLGDLSKLPNSFENIGNIETNNISEMNGCLPSIGSFNYWNKNKENSQTNLLSNIPGLAHNNTSMDTLNKTGTFLKRFEMLHPQSQTVNNTKSKANVNSIETDKSFLGIDSSKTSHF